jgi:hypothetical protein
MPQKNRKTFEKTPGFVCNLCGIHVFQVAFCREFQFRPSSHSEKNVTEPKCIKLAGLKYKIFY